MADTKTAAPKAAPAQAQAQAAAPATAPAKPKRGAQQLWYDSAEAAKKEAETRTEGPRRAFKVTDPSGKERFIVTHHERDAIGHTAQLLNTFKCEELGAKARAKITGLDAIMNAIALLPKEEQERIQALMTKK